MVEHRTENPCVPGSSPGLGTIKIFYSSDMLTTEDLFRIFWRERRIIISIMLISLVVGIFFEKQRAPIWKVSLPLTIFTQEEKETTDFNYDHYYSFEATDTLTDSLEEWLKNPSLRAEVQRETKMDFKSADWIFWEKNNWQVRKKAPQMVEIVYFVKSEEAGRLLEKSLEEKVSGYLDSFNQSGKPYFVLTKSTSAVELLVPRWILIFVVSLIWGFFISLILVIEKENWRKNQKLKEKHLVS